MWDTHLDFSVELVSKVWFISFLNKYLKWIQWGSPSTKCLPLSFSIYYKDSEYELKNEYFP